MDPVWMPVASTDSTTILAIKLSAVVGLVLVDVEGFVPLLWDT